MTRKDDKERFDKRIQEENRLLGILIASSFTLFLALSAGTVSLLMNENRYQYQAFVIIGLILAFLTFFVFLAFIYVYYRNIKRL